MMYIILIVVIILVCFSIFVNGWTDAPNAITTVISTRVLSPKAAVALGAVFNLIGIMTMGSAVAVTTANIVLIGTGTDALITIGAAQISIIIWAVSAWRFGIPTSESHALIASLMGAGISLRGIEAFNWESFKKVLIGLAISTIVGFVLSLVTTKAVRHMCKNVRRAPANRFFSRGQILSASLMAFGHGAQDGQKFMGILVLALTVSGVFSDIGPGGFGIPVWIMVLCAVIMAAGTSVGGYRIIKTIGMEMVRLEKYQGFAAEVVASGSMIAATVFGIPLSTTNTKGSAMLGAGASRGFNTVKWSVARDMIMAWILTFPGCLLLGYLFQTIFSRIQSLLI